MKTEKDESSLGTAAVADSELPPSTPADVAVFYKAGGTDGVEEWRVESRTAKTWTVRHLHPHLNWTRTVRSADIGKTYFLTPLQALEAQHKEVSMDLHWASQRVQNHRTRLGMIESAMKRLQP